MIKDVFSFKDQSISYDIARPTYPDELIEKILQFTKNKGNLLDVGTGTGILIEPLFRHFNKSIGIDISETQISIPKNRYKDFSNLQFKIGYSHKLEEVEENMKYDVISVGQAFHWFDDKLFFSSVEKVLKNDGIIALTGYNMLRINDDKELSKIVDDFYTLVKPHFEFDRTLLEKEYETYKFPFELIKKYRFVKKQSVYVSKIVTYLESFSAYRCYLKKIESNQDPILDVKKYLTNKVDYEVSIETDFFLIILSNDKSLSLIDNM